MVQRALWHARGMHVESADGVRLTYESAGQGAPAIVFVHGLGCDRSYFAPQFEYFAARHAATALDLRGHGESSRPADGRYDVETLADDVLAVARAATPRWPAGPDQPARADLPARPDQPAGPDLSPRPDQPARADLPARPDQPAGLDLSPRPDQPARADLPARPDQPAGPDQPVDDARPVVVGHSLGGLVALACAARPDAVRAAALVDPAPLGPKGRAYFGGHAADVAADADGSWRKAWAAGLFLPSDTARRADTIDHAGTLPPADAAALWRAIAEFDGADVLARVEVPVLAITAGPPQATLRENHPMLTVGRTVGAGHFAQLEVPDQVDAMIERFLLLQH
jgi:pimeloyl-ACP methyl ester carboxylesterase